MGVRSKTAIDVDVNAKVKLDSSQLQSQADKLEEGLNKSAEKAVETLKKGMNDPGITKGLQKSVEQATQKATTKAAQKATEAAIKSTAKKVSDSFKGKDINEQFTNVWKTFDSNIKELNAAAKRVDSSSKDISRSFDAIKTVGKRNETVFGKNNSGQPLLGALIGDGLTNGKGVEEIAEVLHELNSGVKNGRTNYFVSEAQAINKTAEAYRRLNKAMAQGDTAKANKEAANMTRWVNAYRGTHGHTAADTAKALAPQVGSSANAKDVMSIVKRVNDEKGVSENYTLKSFQETANAITKASNQFGMHVDLLFDKGYLGQTSAPKQNKAATSIEKSKTANRPNGIAKDFSKSKQSRWGTNVPIEAVQHRVDTIQETLDKVWDYYVSHEDKTMDEAIKQILGDNKAYQTLSKFQERLRLTDEKQRYKDLSGRGGFRGITSVSKRDKDAIKQEWKRAHFRKSYGDQLNQEYTDFVKGNGGYKVNLPKESKEFNVPKALEKVESAAKDRLTYLQNFLDGIAQKVNNKEGGSLKDYIQALSKTDFEGLQKLYGEYVALGGDVSRYTTFSGQLPFKELASGQVGYYKKHIKTQKYIDSIFADQQMRRQRKLKEGQSKSKSIQQKTSSLSAEEEDAIVAQLAQEELERIAKETPTGKDITEQRRNELRKKLNAALTAGIKSNKQGNRFSVAGAYGVGNDAQIRSDFYEFLAAGGDMTELTYGGLNPFMFNEFNVPFNGRSAEQESNYWKNIYHSNKPDYGAMKQQLQKAYEEEYKRRAATTQTKSDSGLATKTKEEAEALREETSAMQENTAAAQQNAQAKEEAKAVTEQKNTKETAKTFAEKVQDEINTQREWNKENVDSSQTTPMVDGTHTVEQYEQAIAKITEIRDKFVQISKSKEFGSLPQNMQSDVLNTIQYYEDLIKTENDLLDVQRQLDAETHTPSESDAQTEEHAKNATQALKQEKQARDELNESQRQSVSTQPTDGTTSRKITGKAYEQDLKPFPSKDRLLREPYFDFEFNSLIQDATEFESVLQNVFNQNPGATLQDVINTVQQELAEASGKAEEFDNTLTEIRSGSKKWSFNKVLNDTDGFAKELNQLSDKLIAIRQTGDYDSKEALNLETQIQHMLAAQGKILDQKNKDAFMPYWNKIQGNLTQSTSGIQDEMWEAMANGGNLTSKKAFPDLIAERLHLGTIKSFMDFDVSQLQQLLQVLQNIETIRQRISTQGQIDFFGKQAQTQLSIVKDLEHRLANTPQEAKDEDPEWVEKQYELMAKYLEEAEKFKAKVAEIKGEVYEARQFSAQSVKSTILNGGSPLDLYAGTSGGSSEQIGQKAEQAGQKAEESFKRAAEAARELDEEETRLAEAMEFVNTSSDIARAQTEAHEEATASIEAQTAANEHLAQQMEHVAEAEARKNEARAEGANVPAPAVETAQEEADAAKAAGEAMAQAGEKAAEGQEKARAAIQATKQLMQDLSNVLKSPSKSNLMDFDAKYDGLLGLNKDNVKDVHTSMTQINEIIKQLTRGSAGQADNLLKAWNNQEGVAKMQRQTQLLKQLGYEVGEIQTTTNGQILSAQIIPIPDKAITNAEQMLQVLFNLKAVEESMPVPPESSSSRAGGTPTGGGTPPTGGTPSTGESGGGEPPDDGSKRTEAWIQRGKAVADYVRYYGELLTLEAKESGLKQMGRELTYNDQRRLQLLRDRIEATKSYIDVQEGLYRQKEVKTAAQQQTEDIRTNAVERAKAQAQVASASMSEIYAQIQAEMNNSDSQMGQFWERINSLAQSGVEGMDQKIDSLKQSFIQLNEMMKTGKISPDQFSNIFNKMIKPFEGASAILNGATPEDVKSRIRQNIMTTAQARGLKVSEGDINFTNGKNIKGSVRVTDKKGQTQIISQQFDAQSQALGRLESAYTTGQTASEKFFASLKSHALNLTTYAATFLSFYRVIGVFKKAVTQIKEFDTALTEMRKVSDESIDRLKNFQQESFNMAEQIGTTAQQIQESTADFLRLGQDFQTAKESAMNANILFNVSEFDSIDDATTSLIAMTQAYKDIDQSHIIDALNKVGNDFSISTSGLAEGLQRSASALTTSGNSLEESIGLITAANQVVQNPENVGAAMKIISLRLAGQKQQIEDMGEDTEGMVTTVSKLRNGIMNATKVASNGMKGVDIEDANGNLKNTYTILQDIADIWQEIGEQDKLNGTNQQNYLLETMAGKNRSNVLASLLQSPDVLRDAYEEAIDSQGSALIENQKYLESIEGHMSLIKNEASQFAYNMLSSSGIKGIIDLGTQLLKLLNDLTSAFGGLSTIGAIGGGIATFKNFKNVIAETQGLAAVAQQVAGVQNTIKTSPGMTAEAITGVIKGNVQYSAMSIKDLTAITNTITDESIKLSVQQALGIQQIGDAAQNASKPVVGFGNVLNTALSGANIIPTLATIGTLVISIGSAIYNAYQKAKQARIQNAAELAGQFKDTSEDLDSQIKNYTKLSESLNKNNTTQQESAKIKSQLLDIQGQISEAYGKQAQGIDLVNGSLDEQIEKLEEIRSKKAGEILAQAGAKGSSKGDFKYAYEAMTDERTSYLNVKGKEGLMDPFSIFKGQGIREIIEWASKYQDRGLEVGETGLLGNKYLSITGTAEEILSVLEDMGNDLSNIPDYENVKETGNYKTLEDWVNNAYKYYSEIINQNKEPFMQYLNMKILDDEKNKIDYSYKGKDYNEGDLGGFYYRYQQAASEYSKALEGSDQKAIEEARATYESMKNAWTTKINEMREAQDGSLDDYQILMDQVTDSINQRAEKAYDMAKNYKSEDVTAFRKRANLISGLRISEEDFRGAAETEGQQKYEHYVQSVLEQAQKAGFITDIKDKSQIDWLIGQMKQLGVFTESVAESAEKAKGTFASFLETASGKDDKTFSELIDDVQSKTSSLEGWLDKLQKGEVDRSGLTDLFQEFPDLASNMQFVQSVTDSMNAEGFVEYSEDMKRALADMNFKSAISNIREMNEEIADEDSYSDAARAAIRAQRDLLISQLDLSDVSKQQVARQVADATFKEEDAGLIKSLIRSELATGEHGAEVIARLLLDDQSATWTWQEWKAQIEGETVKVELEAPVEEFKKSIESVQDMVSKNSKIASLEEGFESGKAKAEDLLSVINSYPTEFEAISSTVSDVLSSENIDGTINGAEKLSDVLTHIKVENLEKSLANAKTDIEKIIAYSQADLKGISAEDATDLVTSDKRGYNVGGKTKEDLLEIIKTGSDVEIQAATLAFGMQTSFTDALDVVQAQLEKTAIDATKTFNSAADSVKSFKDKVAEESVTSEDVLGLVETFPEILQYTDVLGQAFSELTLNGVLSDASQLESILTRIAQIKLEDMLKANNITDQDVVQGLANQIDFSSIQEGRARVYKNWLKNQYDVDLSNIDETTEEGRNIIARVKFVYDYADVKDGEKVISDSTAQAVNDGFKSAMGDVKALDSALSSLDDYMEKALSGTLAASDLDSIYESFGELITDGDQLNALYGSLNMENLVSDAQTATSLINGLKIAKIQKFVDEQEGSNALTKATQRAMVNQTRLTGVTEDQALAAMEELKGKSYINHDEINKLFQQGQYSAIVRMNLYPEVENSEEFYANLKSAVDGYTKDVEESLKVGIEIVSNIGSSNSSIDDFTDKLKNGEASMDDVLSLMKDAPKVAEEASDEMSKLLNNTKEDGTLRNIKGVESALAHIKYENLEKGVEQVAELNDLTGDSYDLLRKSAFATADLSGISAEDAKGIVDKYAEGDKNLQKMAQSSDALKREAAAVAAGMGASYDQVYDRILARQEQVKVSAVQSFQSMSNEVSSFAEKVKNKEATSEDILGLVDTFPELLNQTDILSDAFSQLTLEGVVNDASTLQALLEKISQMHLRDILQANGIRNQDVVQGLANTLDFSHTDKATADQMKRQLAQAGYDMSGVDTNTKQGLEIMGNIIFTWNNADIDNLGEVISNAISNASNKGVKEGLSNVQALADSMSTLGDASSKILAGEFTIDDVAALEETFSELNLSGEELNAIYSSLSMDNFVQDAELANSLVNKLKTAELTKFFTETQGLSSKAQRSILNATRLTGIGYDEGKEAYENLMQNREDVDKRKVQELWEHQQFDVLYRINMIPEYVNLDEFSASVRESGEAAAKDSLSEIQVNLDVITNLQAKNSTITSFVDSFASGEATIDGLISLLQEVPELALNNGKALAKMISTADFDYTLTSIEGIQEAATKFSLKNLEDQFKQIEKFTQDKDLRSALKGYAVDMSDLSGATGRDVNNALKEVKDDQMREMLTRKFRKGEFTAEALMKVALKGEINDADVMQKLYDEEAKISQTKLSASVQAEINLRSDMSSLDELQNSIMTNEASVDDILGLMNSMPKFLKEVDKLGLEVADLDADGLVDNAEAFSKAIANTKLQKVIDFVKKDGVSKTQAISNIMSTSLRGLTYADREIQNSKLFELLSGGNYTAEAAFKTDVMLDNGLLDNSTETIQSAIDSIDTDVRIRTAVEGMEQTIANIETLDSAISEFNDTGNVSQETIDALSKASFSYNDILYETESGIKVNMDAANSYKESLTEASISLSRMITEQAINKMKQNRQRMEEIVEETKVAGEENLTLQDILSDSATYGERFAEAFELNNVNNSIAEMTGHLQNMEAELRNSIDLFNKFQQAQSSANPSDNYNTVQSAMEGAKELWDQGWVGKDDFTSFAQLIAPEGTQLQDAIRNFEQNYEHAKRYITEDTSGLWNFIDDAEAKGYFEDTGDGIEMTIESLDEFAKEMGISTSLAEQFFFAMKDMNFDVDFSSLTDNFRDQIDELSGHMGEAGAGQQLSNIISQFTTLTSAGEDVRDCLDPLISSLNEFQRIHPGQDIQPWIDQLNALGLLNGFTISVNEDGSLAVVTSELEQTANLIHQIRGSDPATVRAEVEVSDEQKVLLHKLFASEEGREALIKCGFQIDENTKFSDLIQQLTDPNYKLTIPAEVQVTGFSKADMPEDVSTATHEQRKGMLATAERQASETETTETPQITTTVKYDIDQDSLNKIQDLNKQLEEPVTKKVILEVENQSEATSTPSSTSEDRSAAPKPAKTGGEKVEQSSSSGVKIDVDSSQVDDALKDLQKLNSFQIGNKKFRVDAINLTAVMNNLTTVQNTQIGDKKFTVLAPGLPTILSQITSIANKLSEIDGKSATATVNIRQSGGVPNIGGITGPFMGTAHVLGSAFVSGTAHAGGKDFTVGSDQVAVVNQIGQESRIHDGRWELLPGGPHLQKLDRDDVIFNAEQTKDLIETGKTARSGKPVMTSAFVNGTANDLVGEEGVEMYVDPRKGIWQTVGETGPEMIDLPKDALVFNNKQTRDLLSKGYTNTRATFAHANGTVDELGFEDFIYNPMMMDDGLGATLFPNGNAYFHGNAYPNGNLQDQKVTASNKGRFTKRVGSSSDDSSNAQSDNTKATKQNTKATEDNTKKKEEEGQVFDWISSRLSYLSEQTSKFADAITEFIDYEHKMLNLIGGVDSRTGKDYGTGELGALVAEIQGNEQGAARYQEEANKVDKPYTDAEAKKSKEKKKANEEFEKLKAMIDSGYKIDIQNIKDENLSKAISDYQQYADAARQAANNVDALKRSLVELYDQWAKAPTEEADKQIERLKKGYNGLEAAEARIEAIAKGGSTQAILDSLLGTGSGKNTASYTLLGDAGYLATRADNRNKTRFYEQQFAERKLALQRVSENFQQFSQRVLQGALDAVKNAPAVTQQQNYLTKAQVKASGKDVAKKYKKQLTKKQKKQLKKGNAISAKNLKGAVAEAVKTQNQMVNRYENQYTITKAQVKQSGAQVAKDYSKQLTKKQRKQLKQGKKTSTKGLKGAVKKAVQQQNKLVKNYQSQYTNETNAAAVEMGKSLAKSYSKQLTKAQKKALKSGEEVSLKGVKNKTLKKKLKQYNKKVASFKTGQIQSQAVEDEISVNWGAINDEMVQGIQSFVDAFNQAETDVVVSAAELAAQKVQEIRDNFDYINEAYETQIGYQETLNKLNEQMIDDADTFGNSVTATMRDRQKYNLQILRHLKESEAEGLQMQLDVGVNEGTILKGSKEWVEMTQTIEECRQAVHDYDVEIKKIELKKFDDIEHHYQTQISLLETMRGYYESVVTDAEKFGDQIFPQMRDYQKANLQFEKQRKQIEADSLQRQLDSAVSSGYIEKYSLEWATLENKIYEARTAVHDYDVQQKELDIKKIQDIVDHYSKIVEFMQTMNELNNIWYNRDEAIGNYKKESYYTTNIADKQAIANKQMQEAVKAQEQFNQLTAQGVYEVNSDSYIAKQAEINKLWKTAYDTQNELAKLEAERIQYQIENFNRILDKQNTFIDNLNTMAGLINDASMWNFDSGNLLEQGQLSMVIDKQTYDNAISNIKQIDAEKNRLLEELRTNANYGQQQFDENMKDLTQQQMDALQDAKSALESFTETVELTAQKQLAALNKVIDKYKESLNKKKEYWDYDKQLKNQNKEIALLEAQSRALADVTDAESKALKAKIDAQIKQRREEQSDTIRDHAVSLQTNGLTDLQNKLQENYDRWAHQFEASSQKQLEVMKATNLTTNQMATTMNNLLSTFGTNMQQMGLQVSTVNAATTSAIYATNNKITAFTRNDSAYTAASRANNELQARMTTALAGPIADTMNTKLATTWTKVTSGGESTINTTLSNQGSVVNEHLIKLEQITATIPAKLDDPMNAISRSINSAIDKAESFEQQAVSTLNNSIGEVKTTITNSVNTIGGFFTTLGTHITTLAQGISDKASLPAQYTNSSGSSSASAALADVPAPVIQNLGGIDHIDVNMGIIATDEDLPSYGGYFEQNPGGEPFAKGTTGVNRKDTYLTQENGGEIITTKNGVLVPLEAGDGIVPAQLTNRLFQMAREYPNLPQNPAANNVPVVQASGNRVNTTITYGSLLTVNGNVDKEALPGLKQILKESYEYTQKRMAQDAQKAGLRKRY